MSGHNPYVATAPDDGKGLLTNTELVDHGDESVNITNGVPVLDSALDSAVAFRDGDWIEGGLDAMSAGLDVMGAIMDPFGTLGSLVAGWIIEHLRPVQDWLDQLCGDPDAVFAESQTWHNVAVGLDGVAKDYLNAVRSDIGGMGGAMVVSYTGYAGMEAGVISGMARVADCVGAGVTLGGMVISGVRDFIEQELTQVIGEILGDVAEALCSVGILAPHALVNAANKCRQLISKAQQFMEKLSRSLSKMADLLHDINPKLEEAAKYMSKASEEASRLQPEEFLEKATHLVSHAKNVKDDHDSSPYF